MATFRSMIVNSELDGAKILNRFKGLAPDISEPIISMAHQLIEFTVWSVHGRLCWADNIES